MRHILALIFGLFISSASAQAPTTTKPSFTDMLTANCTAVHLLIGGAVSPGCGPTGATAGDIAFFNGTSWTILTGNTTTTKILQETSAGVPSWVAAAGTGTVTSVTCGTGLDGGTFTTTGTCSLSAARRTAQTHQNFFTGSGTYTTPANVTSLDLIIVGGGGGGEGGGTAHGNGGTGGNTCWNTTGAACTTPVYQAAGGVGGATAGGGGGAISGSANCDMAFTGGGGTGTAANIVTGNGETGGNNRLGGAGGGGTPGGPGFAGASNSGSGGGGGSSNGAAAPGAGGGAGGYCEVHISTPAATYTYAIGAAGTAGTTGSAGGQAGGAGGNGAIFVKENYNIN